MLVDNNPRPYEWVMMGSGVVMLLFSFFSWFSLNVPDSGGSTDSSSAWGGDLRPLATIIPLIGLLLAVLVVVRRFTGASLPETVLGLTWAQIYLAMGVLALITAIGLLIMDKVPDLTFSGGGESIHLSVSVDPTIGFWFNLLGAVGLVVGGVLAMQEEGVAGGGAPGPAAPPQAF